MPAAGTRSSGGKTTRSSSPRTTASRSTAAKSKAATPKKAAASKTATSKTGAGRATARTMDMAPASARATSARAATRPVAKTPDAIQLLKQEHRMVDEMFTAFENARTPKQKQSLVNKILMALRIHTQIEEEIFYPASRGEVEDDLLDEAKVEHTSAKMLMDEIQGMQPGEELYDAKVTVLGEYVRHHVKEEEREMFPQAKKADLDLKALGEQLAMRRRELEREMKSRVQ